VTQEPDNNAAGAREPRDGFAAGERPIRDSSTTDELEIVDGLPVLSSDSTEIEATAPAGGLVPTRQVAALAATGFVAGAATVAVIHRRRSRSLPRRARKRAKKGRVALGEVVTSNSFLVDVHLLRRD
jgi:hypothetical protein